LDTIFSFYLFFLSHGTAPLPYTTTIWSKQQNKSLKIKRDILDVSTGSKEQSEITYAIGLGKEQQQLKNCKMKSASQT
jgi:hypothetical protein